MSAMTSERDGVLPALAIVRPEDDEVESIAIRDLSLKQLKLLLENEERAAELTPKDLCLIIKTMDVRTLVIDKRKQAAGLGKKPAKVENNNFLTMVFDKSEEEIAKMGPVEQRLYLDMSTKAAAMAVGARE